MTRAATEAGVKRCADHRTERLPYLEWHDKAPEAHRKGIRQRRCDECRRWYWPWEMREKYSRDTQRKDGERDEPKKAALDARRKDGRDG